MLISRKVRMVATTDYFLEKRSNRVMSWIVFKLAILSFFVSRRKRKFRFVATCKYLMGQGEEHFLVFMTEVGESTNALVTKFKRNKSRTSSICKLKGLNYLHLFFVELFLGGAMAIFGGLKTNWFRSPKLWFILAKRYLSWVILQVYL